MTSPGRSSIGVRVRPNANDFIRDLERQLASKKKTFYVDVHANLKPANKDLKQWQNTTLKTFAARVPIWANTAPAAKDMAAFRAKQRAIKTKVPIGVDLTGAYAQLMAFRRVAGKPIDIELKISATSAARSAQRFQEALNRHSVSIPVNVDRDSMTRTAQKIDTDLIRRLQNQGGVLLPVSVNTNQAQSQFTSFTARNRTVKSQLDLDLKKARLELTQLRAEQLRRKLEINVDVKRSGLDRFTRGLNQIEKSLGNFNFIRSLDFGPVNLGKPGGLLGTLTTVTALAGAVPAAATAVTALSKAVMDLAGAASIAPGAIGGLLASISTFSVGVSGMSDAFEAMMTMWTETPAQAAQSARRSVQAHNQLRQAVREEATAQREVASARREATNDLRNLNNELRGSVLNEAQAILDLQRARDRLAQGGFETSTDLKQAQLDEAKAVQSLIDVRERNGQLQQKVNEENAKGVEGSDKVQSALERQTRAAEQAAMALEAISSTQATSALGKFQQELDQLTPNARNTIMVLAGMKGEFESLRNMVQETMFANAPAGLQRMLDSLMPVVGPGMQQIAAAMNQNILQVFDSLGSTQGQSIIERILGGTAEAQRGLTNLIDPLVRGVGTLMAAGAEHLPQVVELFTRLADRFANFIESADKSGKLDAFMDRGVDALGKMAELGINLIQIINNLGGAFQGDLLQGLVDVTQKFEDWIKSAEGQRQINEWIQQARDLWADWKPVLEDLPTIFEAVGDAARILIDGITPFINLFTSAMKEAPGLVSAFVGVWLGSKLISGFLHPVMSMLTGIIKGFKALPGLAAAAAGLPDVLASKGGKPGTPGGGAPKILPALGAAARTAGPLAVATGLALAPALLTPQDNSLSDEDRDKIIAESNAKLPPGVPKADSQEAGQVAIVLNADGKPAGKWLNDALNVVGTGGRAEFARRWAWLMSQPNAQELMDNPNFEPPASYDQGGFTPWGVEQGKMAVLHGKEYIQPHQTVAHYGVEAMEAIHQRRVPKGLLQSFYPGGFNAPPIPHLPPTPISSGVGTGPAPGPVIPPMPGQQPVPMDVSAYGPMQTQPAANLNMFGLDIPLGQQQPGGGWGPGGPPIGLGGGDGFDIRRFGIGPGPAGSGPNDWLNFAGQEIGSFASGLVSTLGQGILGAFGLEGILNSPYFAGATGLLGHFLNPQRGKTGVQAPGAANTNLAIDQALGTYYGMPVNPATGAPDLGATILPPSVADPTAPGNGGLQVNTLRGKALIQQAFPWATKIGGVRQDEMKWHPSGLALDVMIPGAGGLNDPTPPEGLMRGNEMYAWLMQNKQALGIDYVLWQKKDHFNHLHVNFAESGYAKGGVEVPGLIIPGQGGQQQSAGSTGIPGLDELNAALGDPSTPPQGNGPIPGMGPTTRGGGNGPHRSAAQGGRYRSKNAKKQGPSTGPGDPTGSLKTMARHLYMMSGLPPNEWGDFDWLVNKESSWNPEARNSSNHYGLIQFSPQNREAYGIGDSSDPMVQLQFAMRYIKERYGGSPAKARAFHNQNGWFDRGGWIMPGQSTVENATGKPELVVPWNNIPALFGGGMATANPNWDQHDPKYPGMPPMIEVNPFFDPNRPWDNTMPPPMGALPAPGPGITIRGPNAPGLEGTGRPQDRLPEDWTKNIAGIGGGAGSDADFGITHDPTQGASFPSFYPGGFFKTGAVPPRPRFPNGPGITQMQPQKPRQIQPQVPRPPAPTPQPTTPAPTPGPAVGAPPAPPTTGVQVPPPSVMPAQVGTGVAAGGGGENHLNPAVVTGIRSGAATVGALANQAVAAATMGATAGMGGAMGGLGGGGMGGISVGGLIQQGGKILENVANVGASFLVGTLTSGTTENPYGVTQRSSQPSGGTRIVDNSQRYGDVYTQSPREFFKQLDLRDAQRSQGALGGYDRYA